MVWRHVWLSAAVFITLSGCAGRHGSSIAVAPETSPELLPAVARGDFSSEIQSLTARALQAPGATVPLPVYRLLLARPCQCLAADACAKANILDLQAQAAVQKAEAKKVSHGKPVLMADVLNYLALEERNRAAAKALEAYYRLGEAEASADTLTATLSQVGAALSKARALKAKGLQVAVDDAALHRQQLEVQAQHVTLHLQIQQLNGELRRRLAFAPCGAWHFWPAEAFHIHIGCSAAQAAVAVGLENRPILLLLGLLERELAEGDPATVRRMLAMVNNAMGQGGGCACLKKLLAILCGTEEERALRQQQLALYHAEREREVVEDILQAVRTIQAQQERLLLVERQVESWHERVEQAEDKEKKGLGSFADTADARVNWLKARQTVAKEIINMQLAWVQLRQAQGVLPLECASALLPSGRQSQPAPASDVEISPRPRSIMPQ